MHNDGSELLSYVAKNRHNCWILKFPMVLYLNTPCTVCLSLLLLSNLVIGLKTGHDTCQSFTDQINESRMHNISPFRNIGQQNSAVVTFTKTYNNLWFMT